MVDVRDNAEIPDELGIHYSRAGRSSAGNDALGVAASFRSSSVPQFRAWDQRARPSILWRQRVGLEAGRLERRCVRSTGRKFESFRQGARVIAKRIQPLHFRLFAKPRHLPLRETPSRLLD